MKKYLFLGVAVVCAAGFAFSNESTVDSIAGTDLARTPEASKVTIFVNETKPYSPMIFGGFLEHFNRQIGCSL
jgi:hypothetical protein